MMSFSLFGSSAQSQYSIQGNPPISGTSPLCPVDHISHDAFPGRAADSRVVVVRSLEGLTGDGRALLLENVLVAPGPQPCEVTGSLPGILHPDTQCRQAWTAQCQLT